MSDPNRLPLSPQGGEAPLYVVTAISNPARYASRVRLYEAFAKYIKASGAHLMTVEAAYGSRPHQVTRVYEPDHVQVRTSHELWHKENLLNIGFSRLPADWEYAAWIDADVAFANPDWVRETLHALQHHGLVQMFSLAQDLSPEHEPFQTHRGFAYCVKNDIKSQRQDWADLHPGYGWAIRRETFDQLGGLIDYAILGAADRHMAHALLGRVEDTIHPRMSRGYKEELLTWQERALTLQDSFGYVPGTLLHYWHGKKSDRRYLDRWQILLDNGFDPRTDLKRDWQGVWQLAGNKPRLRDQMQAYFKLRKEDGQELDPKRLQVLGHA